MDRRSGRLARSTRRLHRTLLGVCVLHAACTLLACGSQSGDAASGRGGSEGSDVHLERMSEEHRSDRGDLPGATSALAGAAPDIWSGEVDYAEFGGVPLRGYLARPKSVSGLQTPGREPGLIVIHEWWGLNENIREMTRQLAGAGYAALAVDLYRGEQTADPAQARILAGAALRRAPELEQNLRDAQAFLEKQGAPRVGSIGWCFGGGWSLYAALELPLAASVVYYGRVVTDPARLAGLETPLLGIFGALDRGIPVEQVREFERQLVALKKPARVLVYENADHAFANPSGNRYQPEAAADAWRETLAFLATKLER